MSSSQVTQLRPTIGIIGFGAFGRLITQYLAPHAALRVYDPRSAEPDAQTYGAVRTDLAAAARCPVVILAVPVSRLAEVVAAIAPHLRPGTLVVDVGSVKMEPVAIMRAGLPADVEILGTHPLFGPQSAADGIAGLKIAVCPVSGRRGRRAAAFLRKVLKLKVIVTTPEAHDREAAAVQGLTHLIARVLVAMEPLPTHMTTRSFSLLMQAVDMVRHDAPEVFEAIERSNPFAAEIRQRFFELAAQVEADLARDDDAVPPGQPSITIARTHAGA
ncbi:prephenate dehydrogenase [Methylobacterium pseudosasicola]|uniref:Prephenate dehydrogenase n=1 Tax=Methylobacterium pseudosasicola TaxID=582667 RepID=A0A1I4QT46_9HYPH|nr:prephenate dehydrogenase [Methylobacterium pseudosasicola]SFM43187.1 prephenate dehydrogenase [Methylobacterium pseudosasicola]